MKKDDFSTFNGDSQITDQETKLELKKLKVRQVILGNLVFFITLIVFFILIYFTWYDTRNYITDSFWKVIRYNFGNRTLALLSTANTFFQSLFTITDYIVRLSKDPGIIRCDAKHVNYFIEYAFWVRDVLNPYPLHLTLVENNQTFCHVMALNESSFYLMDLFPDETGTQQTYVFTDYIDENDFDPDRDGYINPKDIQQAYRSFYADYSPTGKWSKVSEIEGDPVANIFYSAYSIYENNLAMTSTPATDIAKYLVDRVGTTDFHFCIVNSQEEIMVNSDFTRTKSSFLNPLLNETGIWAKAYDKIINLSDHQQIRIPIEDNGTFVFSKTKLQNISGEPELYTALYISPPFKTAYKMTSIIVIITTGACVVAVLVLESLLKNYEVRFKAKLQKYNEEIIKAQTKITPIDGAVTTAINFIRRLQLAMPDDKYLNYTLDKAVISMTAPEGVKFLNADDDCPYCKLLATRKIVMEEEECYLKWRMYLTQLAPHYPAKAVKSFNYDLHAASPNLTLIQLIVWIIKKNRFVFIELDPDNLIKFLIHVSLKCTKPIHTAHALVTLRLLFKRHFSHWLFYRLDEFIAFVSLLCLHIEPDPNDFPALYAEFNDLKDQSSLRDYRIEYIFALLENDLHLSEIKNEKVNYFKEKLRTILTGAYSQDIVGIIGSVLNRRQSPDISTATNYHDSVAFTELVVMFADFCYYYSQKPLMVIQTEYMSDILMTQDEMNDPVFYNTYHYLTASRIVRLMMKTLETMTHFEEIRPYLKKTIKYFKKRIENALIEEAELPE